MFLAPRTAFCIVAEDDGEVVGFTLIDSRYDRPAYVVTIDVEARFRRRGIASLLLEETERRLRKLGVRSIRLEAAEDNPAALDFYKSKGFVPIGRKRGYYNGRLDAISLRKELGQS